MATRAEYERRFLAAVERGWGTTEAARWLAREVAAALGEMQAERQTTGPDKGPTVVVIPRSDTRSDVEKLSDPAPMPEWKPATPPAPAGWNVLDKDGYLLREMGDGSPTFWPHKEDAERVAKSIGGSVAPHAPKSPKPYPMVECSVCGGVDGQHRTVVVGNGDENNIEPCPLSSCTPPVSEPTGEVTTRLGKWLHEMRELRLLNDGHVFYATEHARTDQRAAVGAACAPLRERVRKLEREVEATHRAHAKQVGMLLERRQRIAELEAALAEAQRAKGGAK